MIRLLVAVFAAVLIVAGLGLALVPWMQEYAEQPSVPSAAVGGDGLPMIDPDNLPKLYPVGDFAMFDQNGDVLGTADLAGQPWIGYMFFTSCPGQCPIMTDNMKKVAEALGADTPVHIAGISVDPENDTPERLTQYRQQYKIDAPHWHMLTGPQQHVQNIALESFKLGSLDDPVFHSDKFVLVDETNTIRGYFTGTDDAEVRQLIEAVDTLLEEQAT